MHYDYPVQDTLKVLKTMGKINELLNQMEQLYHLAIRSQSLMVVVCLIKLLLYIQPFNGHI